MTLRYLCLVWVGISVFLGISCSTQPKPQETPLRINKPVAPETPAPAPARQSDRGIGDEIRSLTEVGIPSSLLRALDLIRTRDLEGSEFGRVMTAVISNLIQKFYPHLSVQVPVLSQSQTHIYSRILRNGEAGVYTAPRPNTQDYLELVLPFLTFGSDFAAYQPERLLEALPDLRRAEELNPRSVLAPYFMGLIYEHANRPNLAISAYTRAYGLSAECYPAVLGQARILNATGQRQEAIQLLQDLLIQFPDNMPVKQQLARTYYANQDWSRAESAIAEILQQDSQNPEFMLMYAHTLVEQGQFFKALVPLDRYGTINKNQRLYLFLRAKVQAEGYHNRSAALNYLRAILKASPADEEVSVYTAALLLKSPQWEEQNEGRALLRGLLQAEQPSLEVIDLVFKDAVQREDWEEAHVYVDKLLSEHRDQYLLSASQVEQGLGNTGNAFAYAQEFHEKNPADEVGAMVYAAALINTGRQREAQRLIESRLEVTTEGTVKAEYYYLRSRIRAYEEEVVQDLRASLFEDPRNLHTLIAMVELYHRRKDQRRVIYYLKQALSFAPENSRLQRYEQEYLR